MTMRQLSATTLAAVLVLNVGGASNAFAQTKCATTDPLYPGAKTHFENGLKLEAQAVGGEKNAHFLVEARDELLIAYRACPLRTAAINLAAIEVELKNPLKAMEYLRDVVRINGGPMKVDADTPQAAYDRYKSAYDRAYASTAHARIDAPSDAVISVDGQELKTRAPLAEPVDLAPGAHTFEARVGTQTKSQRLELVAGQDAPVSLLPAFTPGTTTRIDVQVDQVRAKPYVVIGLAALGALGVAGGFLFGAKAGSNDADISEIKDRLGPTAACPAASTADCSKLTELRDSKNRNGTIGIVSFVGGGVFAGAAIATALLWRPSKEGSKSAVVSPSFGPGHVGLDLSARF